MDGYELTERGKILVAILLVLLFLLIPSAIILYSAMSGGASPADASSGDSDEPQVAGVHAPMLSILSDDKTKSAIISDFAAFGIRGQRLSSINNHNCSEDGPFKVYMSFNAYSYQ